MSRTRARMHGRSWSNEEYRQALEAEQSAARAHLEAMASGRVPLDWAVPQALRLKVGPGGEFLPFYGDTVVFPLSPAEIAALAGLRDRLVEGLEDLFAEPLDPREFHLTLHDLSNGADLAELEPRLARNEAACRAILATLAGRPGPGLIRLRPTFLFPCLNISVLAGYRPATDEDLRRLLESYSLFDPVVRLPYWLRPHVTLAYFRPRPALPAEVQELARRLVELGPLPDLELDLRRLVYQRFESMNCYRTVARVEVGGSEEGL